MKMIKTVLVLLLAFQGVAQVKPQKVESVVKVMHDFDWYTTQYELWEKELENNPKDDDAWINLFTAARMAKIMAKDLETKNAWLEKEKATVADVKSKNKNSFSYYRIHSWHNDIWSSKSKAEQDKIISYAEKAHQLKPENPGIYPDLMNIYEIYQNDADKKQEIAELWKASGYHTPALMAVTYNALMNTSENSILITGGDNDTYPLWIAQLADDFRADVNVWNIYLLGIPEYRNRLFKEAGIPSLEFQGYDKNIVLDHIIKHKGNKDLFFYSKGIVASDTATFEKLYNVGLIYKYAEESFNNSALIVNFFENKFILDYLKYDYFQSEYPEMDKRRAYSYLPGLVSLFQHYELIGNKQKAEETKALTLKLSEGLPNRAQIKSGLGLDE
ncbi:hypothetical protein [Brumimicrobium aurantiacum]|uniref:Uncharacterized protein n=1 Tax=Brumimicrobium aurantiacum TaxID=1737063 RepID=A0A3E1EW25_9FLAO|nr:hypothetical protein [Brumimicrobium aurantiacum]RFC53761.1 hypothetical protein DXU93_11580 [Brumimicrobium aurantiacum]